MAGLRFGAASVVPGRQGRGHSESPQVDWSCGRRSARGGARFSIDARRSIGRGDGSWAAHRCVRDFYCRSPRSNRLVERARPRRRISAPVLHSVQLHGKVLLRFDRTGLRHLSHRRFQGRNLSALRPSTSGQFDRPWSSCSDTACRHVRKPRQRQFPHSDSLGDKPARRDPNHLGSHLRLRPRLQYRRGIQHKRSFQRRRSIGTAVYRLRRGGALHPWHEPGPWWIARSQPARATPPCAWALCLLVAPAIMDESA